MHVQPHRTVGLGAVALLVVLSALFASAAAGRGPNERDQTDPGTPRAASTISAPQPALLTTPDQLFHLVSGTARDISTRPYHFEPTPLPKSFRSLGYDGYRRLRPRAENSIWRDEPGQFAILPLPRGYIFSDPIELNLVEDGLVHRISDASSYLDFQDFASATPAERSALGVSGWRALFPYGDNGKVDEAAVFQGGAYFRSLAKGLVYGASARALAIGTASRKGEEFPRLTRFWILKPAPDATSLTVAALLDTDSATGAYLFTIQPGQVDGDECPRRDLSAQGNHRSRRRRHFVDVPAQPGRPGRRR